LIKLNYIALHYVRLHQIYTGQEEKRKREKRNAEKWGWLAEEGISYYKSKNDQEPSPKIESQQTGSSRQ
jgi:hypothetical protein